MIVAVIAGGLWIDARFVWPPAMRDHRVDFDCVCLALSALQHYRALRTDLVYGDLRYWRSVSFAAGVGLGDYQFHNITAVCAARSCALLMTLGLITIRIVPRWFTGLVILSAIAWGAHVDGQQRSFWRGVVRDVPRCRNIRQSRMLYATMFVLALIMEPWRHRAGQLALDGSRAVAQPHAKPTRRIRRAHFMACWILLVLNALLFGSVLPAEPHETQGRRHPRPFPSKRRAEP